MSSLLRRRVEKANRLAAVADARADAGCVSVCRDHVASNLKVAWRRPDARGIGVSGVQEIHPVRQDPDDGRVAEERTRRRDANVIEVKANTSVLTGDGVGRVDA
jgi:hypothetical protein